MYKITQNSVGSGEYAEKICEVIEIEKILLYCTWH
jgi:hypothetical protein